MTTKETNVKEYEISFLLASPETEKTVTDILAKNGAEVFNQKAAAQMELAYPIQKHSSAYFGFYHFRSNPENVEKIDAAFRLSKDILRFLVVTPPVKPAAPQIAPRPTLRKQTEQPALSNEALEEKLEEILK